MVWSIIKKTNQKHQPMGQRVGKCSNKFKFKISHLLFLILLHVLFHTGLIYLDFPGDSAVKNLPATQEPQETWTPPLGQEDALGKGMATHSGILACRIPWTEEPGGPQSRGSQRVGHDWGTRHTSWYMSPGWLQRLTRSLSRDVAAVQTRAEAGSRRPSGSHGATTLLKPVSFLTGQRQEHMYSVHRILPTGAYKVSVAVCKAYYL